MQSALARSTTPRSAAVSASVVAVPGNTTALVSPARFRAISTGTLSLPSPRGLLAAVPRFRVRRTTERDRLKLRRRNRLVGLDDPREGRLRGRELRDDAVPAAPDGRVVHVDEGGGTARQESDWRIASAYCSHRGGGGVPAIAVPVRSLNFRRRAGQRYRCGPDSCRPTAGRRGPAARAVEAVVEAPLRNGRRGEHGTELGTELSTRKPLPTLTGNGAYSFHPVDIAPSRVSRRTQPGRCRAHSTQFGSPTHQISAPC